MTQLELSMGLDVTSDSQQAVPLSTLVLVQSECPAESWSMEVVCVQMLSELPVKLLPLPPGLHVSPPILESMFVTPHRICPALF